MQIQCNELLLGPDIEDLYWEPVYYPEVLISELTWNSFQMICERLGCITCTAMFCRSFFVFVRIEA